MAPQPEGLGRTASEQGWYQFSALCITLGIAIGGGTLTGFLCGKLGSPIDSIYDDDEHWHDLKDDTRNKIGIETLTAPIERKKTTIKKKDSTKK
jgi:hypothetical protein